MSLLYSTAKSDTVSPGSQFHHEAALIWTRLHENINGMIDLYSVPRQMYAYTFSLTPDFTRAI